jgi:hypothetical protein
VIFAAVFLIVVGVWLIRASRKQPNRPVPTVLVIPVEIVVALPEPKPTREAQDFAAWSDELEMT